MDRDELFKMAAEKALAENSWDTIEWVCKPTNQFELLLRLCFDETKQIAYDWLADDSPTAMPHRFRDGPWQQLNAAIEFEEFYRKLCELRLAV